MNVWKPLAITAIAALTLVVGYQAASAAGTVAAPQAGVCHDQANMAAANQALHSARASLDRAEHNKGGWRAAAIEATNKAIVESDRGCAFADTH